MSTLLVLLSAMGKVDELYSTDTHDTGSHGLYLNY